MEHLQQVGFLKPQKNTVEYIQVISGKSDESTINFNLDLRDFQLDNYHSSKISNIRIVAKLLASNKGSKRQLNLIRLLTAGGIEFIKYLGMKKDLRVKNRNN